MRISIEGNIGSGKSTALARCHSVADCTVFPEPLEEWGEILDLYFEDKATWALPLTLDILRGFHRSYSTAHAIVERSPMTCRYVFTEILRNDVLLRAEDMAIVEQYMSIFGWEPDAIVYIHVDPSTCLDRIKDRARPGEVDAVTYDELRMIEHQYEKMFATHLKHVPIVRLRQRPDELEDAFHARVCESVTTLLNTQPQKKSGHCTTTSTSTRSGQPSNS